MKYAKMLKALRRKGELSQADVAHILKVCRTSYLAVEKGTRELSLDEAFTLANLYNISVEDIIKGRVSSEYVFTLNVVNLD